jgi:hypothetical protein
MLKKPITIIAVNPGTKYVAIAVFRGIELREWFIKTFKGPWSAMKMKTILSAISDLIERYKANALAIKCLHHSRSSRNLDLLVSKMKNEGKRRRIRVHEYSIGQMENAFCPGERGTKRRMAEALILEYPALWGEFEKEKRRKNPYYTRLFEAIALGSICQDDLDRA